MRITQALPTLFYVTASLSQIPSNNASLIMDNVSTPQFCCYKLSRTRPLLHGTSKDKHSGIYHLLICVEKHKHGQQCGTSRVTGSQSRMEGIDSPARRTGPNGTFMQRVCECLDELLLTRRSTHSHHQHCRILVLDNCTILISQWVFFSALRWFSFSHIAASAAPFVRIYWYGEAQHAGSTHASARSETRVILASRT